MRVVYSAYGDAKVFEELRCSVRSLWEHNPGAIVECYTNTEGKAHLKGLEIDVKTLDIRTRHTNWHDPNFKVRAILAAATSPFIFIDNDTYVTESLKDAWRLLDKFDIMAVPAPIKNQRAARGMEPLDVYDRIPSAFPEVNTGVLFLNATRKTDLCLAKWAELLDLNSAELGDQWRFRIALYESDARFFSLPANYNFRITHPSSLYGPAIIIHGHHRDWKFLEQEINRIDGYRSFTRIGDRITTSAVVQEPRRSSAIRRKLQVLKKNMRWRR